MSATKRLGLLCGVLLGVTAATSFAENDDGGVFTTPLVTNDLVYVGTRVNCVYAFERSCTQNDTCVRWGYKTGNQVLSNPSLGKCHVDQSLIAESPSPTNPKLSPELVDFDCLFVGSNDGYLYALDPDNGTCVWRRSVGGLVQSQPLISDDEVFIGTYSTGSSLFSLGTYPEPLASPPPGCSGCATDPFEECCLSVPELWATDVGVTRFDPFHPLDSNGDPILDRLVVGTGDEGQDPKGLVLIDADTGEEFEDGRVWDQSPNATAFGVSAVSDGSGRIYASGGSGENDSENRIVAVEVAGASDDELQAVDNGSVPWEIRRETPTDYPNLQVHRSQPLLSEGAQTLYQGTRADGTQSDERRLFAFHTSDASEKWSYNQTDPQGVFSIPNKTGITATGATRCTPCQRRTSTSNPQAMASLSAYHPDEPSDPCGSCNDDSSCPAGQVDTVFIGNKNKRFFAVQDCGDEPELKWVAVLDHQKIRSTPAVTDDTVYVGDDADSNASSKFYALDRETGVQEWEQQISLQSNQCREPAPTSCYVSPVPTVVDLNNVVKASGCTSASTVRLASFFVAPQASTWDEAESLWVNETPGGSAPTTLGCPFGCWADFSLVANQLNSFTVTFTDTNGRSGGVRVKITQDPNCTA